jgi:periplasmic protein TonB
VNQDAGTAEKPVTKPESSLASTAPLEVGSLIGYATNRSQPVYPAAAKTIRATGVVKVDVTVNEAGEVTEIQKASGPPMLQSAAKDAIRKWRFKPFIRDGQPVKATGFVSFNFSL